MPPIYPNTAGTAARSTPGPEITIKIEQNTAPATKATFLIVGPEPTGNPSKNPQKHLKKPLPPVRCTADGREEGGWLGWLGWAGWVTAEAGLAGLAGLG